MSTDDELLDRWAHEGDQRAGKELVERYFVTVFRFFRAKVDREVDDLVQQTFLGLVEARDRYGRVAGFRSYLFGIARNVLRGHFRRRQRKDNRVDFTTRSVIDLGASPSAVLADKGERRLLLEALRRLPVDDQIAIELYHWEGLTGPELAAVLDLTEPAVRSRLHRAKARLAESMKQLADSQELVESTLTDLDRWALRLRDDLMPSHRPSAADP